MAQVNYVSDILSRIIEKETPPFRPIVPPVESISEIDDVMRMSWEEVPLFRPTFTTILESLKKFNNGRFVFYFSSEHLTDPY